MAVIATAQKTRSDASQKRASTRLLDLLAGWSAFLSEDESNGVSDSKLSAEDVANLYQLAGARIDEWDTLEAGQESKAVRAFIEDKILPFRKHPGVLSGKPGSIIKKED